MFHEGGLFWGMHMIWWLVWIVLFVGFFSYATPVPRRRMRETPFEVLRRRYAAGEISTTEYEERKEKLMRDTAVAK